MPGFIRHHRVSITVALCVVTAAYVALAVRLPNTAAALGVGYMSFVITVVVLLRSYGRRHDR